MYLLNLLDNLEQKVLKFKIKPTNKVAYFILILTTIFWSGNFIVGKAASIYDIPPFSLNFYRWFFAGLILLPFTYKEIASNKKYILDNLGRFFYNIRHHKYYHI